MARTKHTRPQEIIAADRVRQPREPRGSGNVSQSRRDGRLLKEFGLAEHELLFDCPPVIDSSSASSSRESNESREPTKSINSKVLRNTTLADARLPRITCQRAKDGFFHPITRQDIQRLLNFFGPQSYYGLREIRLSQAPSTAHAVTGMLFGRLYIPGKVLLYEQKLQPWHIAGRISAEDATAMTTAGAIIESSDDGMRCIVRWSEDDLKNFFLFDVLMHEIGHHLQQQFKGKRTSQVLRTSDHERLATLFANRCRDEFVKAGENLGSGDI